MYIAESFIKNTRMIRDEVKSKISDLLVDMILALEDRFDVEFDHDDEEWHEIENKLTNHLIKCEILSEEEIQDNELLNHADALSDESRGR